jgi:hypothetical protein
MAGVDVVSQDQDFRMKTITMLAVLVLVQYYLPYYSTYRRKKAIGILTIFFIKVSWQALASVIKQVFLNFFFFPVLNT